MKIMGRPRKIKSVKALEEAWEEYKEDCNNRSVLTHDFSSKNSEFVSAKLKRSVTYTIEGFCVFIGLARSTFYQNYGEDEKFSDTVTRMREECEIDAREKFELGVIPFTARRIVDVKLWIFYKDRFNRDGCSTCCH